MTVAEWCVFGTLMLYLLTIASIKWIGFRRFDNARPRDPNFYDDPIGARALGDDMPKYLNSPESAVFDKSSTLYALHQAAQTIRTSRVAIVTEGYMDAIAVERLKEYQAGLTEYLTSSKADLLATIGTEKSLNDSVTMELKSAADQFAQLWVRLAA